MGAPRFGQAADVRACLPCRGLSWAGELGMEVGVEVTGVGQALAHGNKTPHLGAQAFSVQTRTWPEASEPVAILLALDGDAGASFPASSAGPQLARDPDKSPCGLGAPSAAHCLRGQGRETPTPLPFPACLSELRPHETGPEGLTGRISPGPRGPNCAVPQGA